MIAKVDKRDDKVEDIVVYKREDITEICEMLDTISSRVNGLVWAYRIAVLVAAAGWTMYFLG